jgi:MFS superfamily sulfate permease-like transporter
MSCLAAVVVSSMRTILTPNDALMLWGGKFSDFLQMIVTLCCILYFDVQNGLFAGMAFSPSGVLHFVDLPNSDVYRDIPR